jgi:hypothetical protein
VSGASNEALGEFDWGAYLDTHCGVCGREYYFCECGESDDDETDES